MAQIITPQPKTLWKWGFSTFLCFCCWKRRKRQNNDNWNFWYWVFWSKAGRFVTHICFSKKLTGTPIFIVFLGARFLGQGVKKGKFWTPTKKGKMWLITEKFIFWYFLCFFCFFSGGFKGQVRWPKGPPHLALNLLIFVFLFCFFVLFIGLSFLCFQ